MATKINVRSPFHIKVTQTNIATATLSLYVYTGTFVANASVSSPKYTISKSVVTSGYITFEIAELVKDYIDTEFVILGSDDEFYLPSALSSCIEFLSKNSEYSYPDILPNQ